jgi:hypothetical protein
MKIRYGLDRVLDAAREARSFVDAVSEHLSCLRETVLMGGSTFGWTRKLRVDPSRGRSFGGTHRS